MTWQDDARAVMDSILVLYEGKDAAKNEQRRRRKAQAIEWHVSEIEKGWQDGGTRCDLPTQVWTSGDFKAIKWAVMIAYGHRCMSCGEPADEVHHIRPRHLGGTDHPRNLVPLCEACHDEVHRRLDAAVAEAIERTTRSMLEESE